VESLLQVNRVAEATGGGSRRRRMIGSLAEANKARTVQVPLAVRLFWLSEM
jgi:hypothetical protein